VVRAIWKCHNGEKGFWEKGGRLGTNTAQQLHLRASAAWSAYSAVVPEPHVDGETASALL